MEHFLFRVVEDVFWVENGWRVKSLRPVLRVFLEVLVCEDVVQIVAELFVVCRIAAEAIVVVQLAELLLGETDTLCVKHSLEFLVSHCALA